MVYRCHPVQHRSGVIAGPGPSGNLGDPLPPNPLGGYDRGVKHQSNLEVEGLKDVRSTRTTRRVLLFLIVLN